LDGAINLHFSDESSMRFLKLATGLILCVMSSAIFGSEPVNVLTAEANDSGREDDRGANTAEEPITLRNVDQVEMLSETSRPVNRLERGPGPNELVCHWASTVMPAGREAECDFA
jgi:hypothetical protein